LDARVYLDPHLIWQATESYVERGDAFGLIMRLPPNPVLLTTKAVYNLSTAARVSRGFSMGGYSSFLSSLG
jgi:hypothetical protein